MIWVKRRICWKQAGWFCVIRTLDLWRFTLGSVRLTQRLLVLIQKLLEKFPPLRCESSPSRSDPPTSVVFECKSLDVFLFVKIGPVLTGLDTQKDKLQSTLTDGRLLQPHWPVETRVTEFSLWIKCWTPNYWVEKCFCIRQREEAA